MRWTVWWVQSSVEGAAVLPSVVFKNYMSRRCITMKNLCTRNGLKGKIFSSVDEAEFCRTSLTLFSARRLHSWELNVLKGLVMEKEREVCHKARKAQIFLHCESALFLHNVCFGSVGFLGSI